MLTTAFHLTADGPNRSLLHWTVDDPALESWVFVDGAKLYGPLLLDTTDRSVPIPLAAGECRAIEIHDVPPETIATPCFETPTTRPELQWNPAPGAARYRLYHRETGGSERRVFDRPATEFEGLPIRLACPIELNGAGGVWHFLRVEAVDTYGNESTRLAWRYYAVAPPSPPSRVEVADGAEPGRFLLTITP